MASDDASAELTFTVDEAAEGQRLDVFLAKRLDEFSRTQLQAAISDGACLVDGSPSRPSTRLLPGQLIVLTPPAPHAEGPLPENIPLDVLYEDADIAVVNKPAGMVVHPARGHWSGTLASALAYRFDTLSTEAGAHRPGIVHRLDRDTTGVIVVARTDQAHRALSEQFASRSVKKTYVAITDGSPDRDRDLLDLPISKHRSRREKMEVALPPRSGRSAQTFFEVTKRFGRFCLLRLQPTTGRTHQLRVHLAHIRCPVVCDALYGSAGPITTNDLDRLADRPEPRLLLERQALHASAIEFRHPVQGETMTFQAELPADMGSFLSELSSGT